MSIRIVRTLVTTGFNYNKEKRKPSANKIHTSDLWDGKFKK
jgi:hypothetical protein